MTTIFDLPSLSPIEQHHAPCQAIPGLDPALARRKAPRIPTLAEPQIARHYTKLSRMNYGVDDGLYPLGSCTMKYNPKLHEQLVSMPEFADLHPGTRPSLAQGTLAALHRMSELLGYMLVNLRKRLPVPQKSGYHLSQLLIVHLQAFLPAYCAAKHPAAGRLS